MDNNIKQVPVIHGTKPKPWEKEFLEMNHYESGKADEDASKIPGPYEEPWLNVVHSSEPISIPGFEKILQLEELRSRIKGRILDIAAGSCWLSGKLSQMNPVQEVFALDLSERFLTTSGLRCMKAINANLSKVRFIVSTFNDIPLEKESVDCAFMIAALHHSLSPIKTLQEVGRCLKPGGCIMILENPPAAIHIRKAREKALALSENVSEIAHTKEELEYVIKASRIGRLKTFTFDILSKPGLKMFVRKIFRHFQIEHLVLNPPTYLFFVEKENSSKGD
jgi:ubiquinone/menaquinone biosynthesis C-methylase UbiE